MRDFHVVMYMSFTRAVKCLDRKELSFLQNQSSPYVSPMCSTGNFIRAYLDNNNWT